MTSSVVAVDDCSFDDHRIHYRVPDVALDLSFELAKLPLHYGVGMCMDAGTAARGLDDLARITAEDEDGDPDAEDEQAA